MSFDGYSIKIYDIEEYITSLFEFLEMFSLKVRRIFTLFSKRHPHSLEFTASVAARPPKLGF